MLASTAVGVAGRLALMAIGFGSVAVVTRYLGPTGYGRYGLAFSLTQMFGIVTDAGLYTIAVRQLAQTPERTDEIAGNTLALRMLLSVAAVALALATAFALGYSTATRTAILIAGAALALDMAAASLRAIFQARLTMGAAVAAQVAGRAVALAAVLGVAAAGLGLDGAVAAASLGALVTLGLTWRSARRIARVRPRRDPGAWRSLLGASAVLGLALAINEVYLRADTVVISVYRPYREVGIYALDYRIADLVAAFPAVLLASVFPVISRHVVAAPERARQAIQLASDAFVITGLGLATGGVLLAAPVVGVVAGHHFAAGADALRLLLAAGALQALNGLFGFSLVAKHRQREALWLNVLALTVNLAGNLALVPPLGINAAAAVTLGGEAVILAGSVLLMRRHLGFFPNMRVLPRAALAAAAMAAALAPLRGGPVIAVALAGMVVYGTVLWLVGAVNRDVLRTLRPPAP